jgi:hypothetical protein
VTAAVVDSFFNDDGGSVMLLLLVLLVLWCWVADHQVERRWRMQPCGRPNRLVGKDKFSDDLRLLEAKFRCVREVVRDKDLWGSSSDDKENAAATR